MSFGGVCSPPDHSGYVVVKYICMRAARMLSVCYFPYFINLGGVCLKMSAYHQTTEREIGKKEFEEKERREREQREREKTRKKEK